MIIPWGYSADRVGGYLLEGQSAGLRLLLPAEDQAGRTWAWRDVTTLDVNGDSSWAEIIAAPATRAPSDLHPATGIVDEKTSDLIVEMLEATVPNQVPVLARWLGYATDTTHGHSTTQSHGSEFSVGPEPLRGSLTAVLRAPSFLWFPQANVAIGMPLYGDSLYISGPQEVLTRIGQNQLFETHGVLATAQLPIQGLE